MFVLFLHFLQGGYSPSGPGIPPSDNYGSIGYGYGAVNFGQMSWRGSQAQLWGGPGSPPSFTAPFFSLFRKFSSPSARESGVGSSVSRTPVYNQKKMLCTPRYLKYKILHRKSHKPSGSSRIPNGHGPISVPPNINSIPRHPCANGVQYHVHSPSYSTIQRTSLYEPHCGNLHPEVHHSSMPAYAQIRRSRYSSSISPHAQQGAALVTRSHRPLIHKFWPYAVDPDWQFLFFSFN